MTETVCEIPSYPMPRASECPFDPPPELGRLQEEQPLSRVRLWDGSTPWLVARYEDQRTVLASPDISADVKQPGYPFFSPSSKARRTRLPTFIDMDDPEHARLRRMLTRNFAIKRVEALRPEIQRITDELIDGMLGRTPPLDLVAEFGLVLPSLVICELLGVPYSDHAFFQHNSHLLVSQTATAEEGLAAAERLRDYLAGLLEAKEKDPGDDVLSTLAEQQVQTGELTRDEVARMALFLLFAGHETTANMISLGTLALLRHPDQLAELRDTTDPTVAVRAVEEMLRYLSIVHSGSSRVAVRDFELCGQRIRAGDGLVIPHHIGNRDSATFAEPDRLDVHRDSRQHIAFSFGVHQCLGQPLARVELQVVYSTLYRRIPTLRLAVDLDQIRFKHDAAVYGVYELPVTW